MVKERIGPVQIAIITLLSRKEYNVSDLFYTLRQLGLRSRSSFYSALYDLEKSGYIEKLDDSYKITEKGREILNEIPYFIKASVMPALSFMLRVAAPYFSLLEEFEDPEFLQNYKDFLETELKRVDGALKKWKKLKVE